MWGRVGRFGGVVLIPSILMRFIDNKFTDLSPTIGSE